MMRTMTAARMTARSPMETSLRAMMLVAKTVTNQAMTKSRRNARRNVKRSPSLSQAHLPKEHGRLFGTGGKIRLRLAMVKRLGVC
jgi:hypothetical protein